MFPNLPSTRIRPRWRGLVDWKVRTGADISVTGAEVCARDNAALAGAAVQAMKAFGGLRERGLIDDRELLRLVYRFAGEMEADRLD